MKSLWLAGLLAVCACARADISYRVTVAPDLKTLHVTIVAPSTQAGSHWQIPNWGPGGYFLGNGATRVHNLTATDAGGKSLTVDPQVVKVEKKYQEGDEMKVAINPVTTWDVAGAYSTTIEYDVDAQTADGALQYSGPATYLYEVNRKKEKCNLEIDVPTGWNVYTGLDEFPPNSHHYSAKDYDTLADNPVSAGGENALIVDSYESRGKTCWIVMRGAAKSKVDREKLLKACKFVTDMETDFFGDSAPYNKYVWHFSIMDTDDGGGGLEHLSSTQISLARGVGPVSVRVMAHEFFHLWNVKRIRSFPLGPFDYTKLPQTGAIWWLEGVTDYYAYTLLHRYGWDDDASYLSSAADNYRRVASNPAFKTISPYDSSMRVDEPNGGHGNSNGYEISYYNLGWLAGMCLDIELRSRTRGKHSLDDVEHALWDLCKNGKPGFQEDEIRKQLVRIGGPDMGPVYDRIVMQPNMPVNEELAKAGYQLAESSESYADLGYEFRGTRTDRMSLIVALVKPSAVGTLKQGDVVLSVNGTDIATAQGGPQRFINAIAAKAIAGTVIKFRVQRDGTEMDAELTTVAATRSVYTVKPLESATADQKAAGAGWIATKKMG